MLFSEPNITQIKELIRIVQITPTRYRVPDLVLVDRSVAEAVPLVVIELLSPEDTLMHMAALEVDYRKTGVEHIWIIDPRQSASWSCTPEGWLRTGTFTVLGTPISLNLADSY